MYLFRFYFEGEDVLTLLGDKVKDSVVINKNIVTILNTGRPTIDLDARSWPSKLTLTSRKATITIYADDIVADKI